MRSGLKELIVLLDGFPDLSAGDRLRAIIAAARRSLRLGPVLIYSVDWRTLTGASLRDDYVRYFPWFMDGVRVLAPMYGIIPKGVSEWLTAGNAHVTSWEEHLAQRPADERVADPARQIGFWARERITSYCKRELNDGRDYIIFNTSSLIDESRALTKHDVEELEELSIMLAPAIARERQQLESEALKDRDGQVVRAISSLYHSLQSKRDEHQDILAELLLGAYRIFAKGDVLGSIQRLERRYADGKPFLWLTATDHVGVPDGLLERTQGIPGVTAGFPVKARPSAGDGVISWVAYHERPLFVSSLNSIAARQKDFEVAKWNRRCMKGVQSVVAVPIKDPRESRLYGVLCFETRTRGAFQPEDVFYLEQFAQQAGAILREASRQHLESEINVFASKPVKEFDARADANTDSTKEIAKAVADYLFADAATIWTLDLHRKGPDEWARYYRSEAEGNPKLFPQSPDAGVRNKDAAIGWTRHLLDTPNASPLFVEVAYEDPRQTQVPAGPVQSEADVDKVAKARPWKHATVVVNVDTQERRNYWYRVSRFKEGAGAHWEAYEGTEVNGVNPHVINGGFYSELAIPLKLADEKPKGVLWAKWYEWKADIPRPEPKIGDMEAVMELAGWLASAIWNQQARRNIDVLGGASHFKTDVEMSGAITGTIGAGDPEVKLLLEWLTLPWRSWVPDRELPPIQLACCPSYSDKERSLGCIVRSVIKLVGYRLYAAGNTTTIAEDPWKIDSQHLELDDYMVRGAPWYRYLLVDLLLNLCWNASRAGAKAGGNCCMLIEVPSAPGTSKIIFQIENQATSSDAATLRERFTSCEIAAHQSKGLNSVFSVVRRFGHGRLKPEFSTETNDGKQTVKLHLILPCDFDKEKSSSISDSVLVRAKEPKNE